MNEARQMEGLLSQICDGVADDEVYVQVRELLKQSKDARRVYLEYLDMDASFQEAAADLREVLQKQPRSRFRRIFRYVAPAIAIAAALAIAFLLPREDDTKPVEVVQATLVSEHAAVWGRARLPSKTEPVEGELRLLSGLAKLKLTNGVEVIVRGPAVFTPSQENRLMLKSGQVTCSVPEAGYGFTVQTPTASVVDFGTVFGVMVRPDSTEEVHTFSGLVQVQSNLVSDTVSVSAGEAVRFDSEGEVASIELRSDAFPRSTKPIVEYERILRDVYDLSKRDQVRVYYTFDDLDGTESRRVSRVTNLAARSAQFNGRVLGAKSTAGRLAGSRALRFSSESDSVRFRYDAELESVTLAAWIRLDALPPDNGFTSLLMTDAWDEPGQIHWQIFTDKGVPKLEFSVRQMKGRNDWYSEPVPRDELMGRWAHIVTTFDGESHEIKFYMNGQQVGVRRDAPAIARIGQGHLGAWASFKEPGLTRPFYGEMDEFVLIARALADTEVEALYRVGKPAE